MNRHHSSMGALAALAMMTAATAGLAEPVAALWSDATRGPRPLPSPGESEAKIAAAQAKREKRAAKRLAAAKRGVK